MRERANKIVEQSGVSLAIVLCMGALLVVLSAALVQESGSLGASSGREISREQAYQLAVSFSDRLKESLCTAPGQEDSLGAFLDGHFLTPEYEAQPLTLSCGRDTDDAYGQITLTLQKQALPMTRTLPLSPGGDPAMPEDARVADYLVEVTVTATLPQASVSYTESYHRWVDCSVVYENLEQGNPAVGSSSMPDGTLSDDEAGEGLSLLCRFEPKQEPNTGYTAVAEEWYHEG